MKNWLLYFFAILLAVACAPLAVSKTAVNREEPIVRVAVGDEIIQTDLESYVLQSLLGEGNPSYSQETLKSLAVALRSCGAYALSFGLNHSGFEFCNEMGCCPKTIYAHKAEKEYLLACQKAVEETRGIILKVENAPFPALFTLCAGSGTTSCKELPALSPVAEDGQCLIHSYKISADVSKIAEKTELSAEAIKRNSCLVYNCENKCSFGVFGGREISNSQLMELFSLPSAEFSITFNEDSVEICGSGAGNGMGLNLCGAEKMAKSNYSYEKILQHYFPNANVAKIYN